MGRKSKISITQKRRSRTVFLPVTLEKVLGLTVKSNASLTCCAKTGIVAYPAGCVIVIFNPRKNRQEFIFNDSKKTITALSFSSDGKHIVSGECGHNPAVRVWDVQEKTQVSEFSGHKFGIACVAFSPDQHYIVSVGEQHDMSINVWDWKGSSGKLSSNKIAAKVVGLAFCEDGSTFVTVGNRNVRFWYFTGKSKTREIVPLQGRSSILGEQKNNFFCGVTYGRGNNNKRVYAITKSGLLCEFNEDRMLDKWVELRTSAAFCITCNEDYLFVGCAGGILRIFSASTLHFVASFPKPHFLGINIAAGIDSSHHVVPNGNAKYPDTTCAVFDDLNKKLICVYNDHSMYVWDLHDVHKIGKQWSFLYHSSFIWSVDVYPDVKDGNKSALPSNSFVTCSSDNTIRIWNVDPTMNTEIFNKNIYSPDLLKVLYVDGDGEDSTDESSSDNKNGVRSVSFSPDGQVLASGDRSGNLRIHDLQFMDEMHKIEAHDSEVLCLEFSDMSETGHYLLASASRDRFIHIFDMNNNCTLLQTLDEHSSSITSVKFTKSNGKLHMISCGADKALLFRIAVYNPDLQFTLNHNIGNKTTLYDMAIDSSKKYVATACQDRNLRIHNISSGKLKQTYKGSLGEDGTLIKVVLDPSGMYAATSCSDKSLHIYDFYSGACVATMMGHSELVTGMKFTNDCQQLISVSGDGCIFVWKLPWTMVNNMKDRLAEKGQSLKVTAVEYNQIRRGTYVVPPEIILQNIQPIQTGANKETKDGELLPLDGNLEIDLSSVQLPLWVKKQGFGEDLPSPTKYASPTQPRGRWAENVGDEPIFLMASKEKIPLRMQDCLDKRRYTIEPDVMSDEEEEVDEDEFVPAEEKLNLLEAQLSSAANKEDLTNVTKVRGSDPFLARKVASEFLSSEDVADNGNVTAGKDATASDEATKEDEEEEEDGEEGDQEEEQEEEIKEVIFYLSPQDEEKESENLEFQVTASTKSLEELTRRKSKRGTGKQSPAQLDVSSSATNGETESVPVTPYGSDDEEEEPTEDTPLSSPSDSSKTPEEMFSEPSSPENDEELFLHQNFTFAEKEKFDQCLQQLHIDHILQRRQSISAKFLSRSHIQQKKKNSAGNSTQITFSKEEILQRRKDEMARALEETKKKLNQLNYSVPETKTPPSTPTEETIPTQTLPKKGSSANSSVASTSSSDNSQHAPVKQSEPEDLAQKDKAEDGNDNKEEVDSKTTLDRLNEVKSVQTDGIVQLTTEVLPTKDAVQADETKDLKRPNKLNVSHTLTATVGSSVKQTDGAGDVCNQELPSKKLSQETAEVRKIFPEIKKEDGADTRKRSSSLTRIFSGGNKEAPEVAKVRTRLRSQSIDRKDEQEPPNSPARQKHRARSDRVENTRRSYERGTESHAAKRLPKISREFPPQKLKKKRVSLGDKSGPLKATEEVLNLSKINDGAILTVTDSVKSPESKDNSPEKDSAFVFPVISRGERRLSENSAENVAERGSQEKRRNEESKTNCVEETSDVKRTNSLVNGALSISLETESIGSSADNSTSAKDGQGRNSDTPPQRFTKRALFTGEESNSIMNVLQESIIQMRDGFQRSLDSLTQLHSQDKSSCFEDGMNSLTNSVIEMEGSLRSYRLQTISSSSTDNGFSTNENTPRSPVLPANQTKPSQSTIKLEDCFSALMKPPESSEGAAMAALTLLDNYSQKLIALIQSKLDKANENEEEEEEEEENQEETEEVFA